jgi:glutamyl-tRNA reductase
MYKLWMFGLNYQSASFEIRERLAFSQERTHSVLTRLQNSGVAREVLILSTCNRTEVYCITQDIDFVVNAICDIQNVCPRTVRRHSYIHSDLECASHLFRVVSGLDSMVLGETEIVAQVKTALQIAQQNRTALTELVGVFQMALAVEKEVRNKIEINNIAVSMGRAVVNLTIDYTLDLSNERVLFVGAGQMMNQIAPHFRDLEVKQKTIVNRTHEKARVLAKRVAADHRGLIDLPDIIDNYSVIVACCDAKSAILDEALFKNRIPSKEPLLIIDLSVPLITDVKLRQYEHIKLLTIDDIAKIVDVGMEKRKLAALEAEGIIEAKLTEYQGWLKKRELSPLIKALRDNAEKARQELLIGAYRQLQNGENAVDVLNTLSLKLMNKLLHEPTVNLCSSVDNLQADLSSLVRHLYDLENKISYS